MKKLTVYFKQVDQVVINKKSQKINLLTNVRQVQIISDKYWWRNIIMEYFIVDIDTGKTAKKDVYLNLDDDYFYIGDF